jgi:hypothetical protein
VLSELSLRAQPDSQRRRQLLIDEESHSAAGSSTGWPTWADA